MTLWNWVYVSLGVKVWQNKEKSNRVESLAGELELERGYYHCKECKRMQYLEIREEGYPIGSGMVESAAKQYKAGFAGSGMRWGREGAAHLLPVRTAIMSKRFDKMWSLAYNSPPN